jgi:anaerobic ribonucleoside-triphosphate reductase activating protein
MSFSAEELADRLATVDGDGLTISGGEPFDQSEALRGFIEQYKELCGKSVIVFTGYEAAELMGSVSKRKAMMLADAVLSGRFAAGEIWENKRLLLISDRIKPEEIRPDGSMEMSVTNGEIFISGYPACSNAEEAAI